MRLPHQRQRRGQMFEEFAASGGLQLPVRVPKGVQYYDRKLP